MQVQESYKRVGILPGEGFGGAGDRPGDVTGFDGRSNPYAPFSETAVTTNEGPASKVVAQAR